MADLPKPGEPVTVLPPYDDDSYILNFQRYGRIARRNDAGFLVTLECTVPPDEEFGPFPAERLAKGWRDHNGRWR